MTAEIMGFAVSDIDKNAWDLMSNFVYTLYCLKWVVIV
jgi:hypothetical protein